MYDFNGNKELENDFFQSIENGDIQHIKCTIRRLDRVMKAVNYVCFSA